MVPVCCLGHGQGDFCLWGLLSRWSPETTAPARSSAGERPRAALRITVSQYHCYLGESLSLLECSFKWAYSEIEEFKGRESPFWKSGCAASLSLSAL